MKTLLGALGLCCFLAMPAQAQQSDQAAGDPFGADEGLGGAPNPGPRAARRGAQNQDESAATPSDRGAGDRGTGAEDRQRGFGPEGRGGRGRGPANPMFEAIDADGDGVINERELRRAGAALKALDTDNDGAITLAEVRPPGGPGGPGGGAEGIFGRFDQNSDGKLTADEIPPQMVDRFRGADTNGDGSIDLQEMTALMESGQFGRGGRGGQGGQGFGRGGPGGGFGGNDPQAYMQQFMRSDRNGDGMLTPNELSQQQIAMLRGADADGNSAISQQEFMQAAQQMAERANRFGGGGQGPGGQRFGRQGARPTDRFNGGNDGADAGQAPEGRGFGRGRRGNDAAEE